MKWKLEFPMGRITRHALLEGTSIEEKMRKATSTKEPIENVAPLTYTERKDGVRPEYDFRTDRFEIARQAKDKFFAQRQAKIAAELAEQAKTDKQTPTA